jgi:hypothetical protein
MKILKNCCRCAISRNVAVPEIDEILKVSSTVQRIYGGRCIDPIKLIFVIINAETGLIDFKE